MTKLQEMMYGGRQKWQYKILEKVFYELYQGHRDKYYNMFSYSFNHR